MIVMCQMFDLQSILITRKQDIVPPANYTSSRKGDKISVPPANYTSSRKGDKISLPLEMYTSSRKGDKISVLPDIL